MTAVLFYSGSLYYFSPCNNPAVKLNLLVIRSLIFFFFFWAGWVPIACAQTPAITWQRSLGSFYGDYAWSIYPTADGGYITAGYTEKNGGDVMGYHGNTSINDLWVVKLDKDGAIEWQKCLGGTYMETGGYVRVTPDGGYIVAGSSASVDCGFTGNHGGLDYWLVKLKANGDQEWQKTYGGSKNEYCYGVDLTPDGGYVLGGHSESNNGDVTGNHGNRDYWVVKTDVNGDLQWQKSLGGSGDDEGLSICAAVGGGYFLTGNTSSPDGNITGYHGSRDAWTVKLDAGGNLVWQKSLGGSQFDGGWSVKGTPDGGCVLAGYTGSYDGDVSGNHGDLDFWVVKLTNTGGMQWQNCYGGPLNETAYGMQLTDDGGYVVAGSAESSSGQLSCNAGLTDAWVIKVNSNGGLVWQKSMGGNYYEEAHDVQPTSDGGFIVAAITCSKNVAGWHQHNISDGTCADFWILRFSAPVASQPNPFIMVGPASGQICLGSPATFTATVVNGGTNPSYQWRRNNIAVGTNSPIFTASDFANNDQLTCTVITGGACEAGGLQKTALVTIQANSNTLHPTVSITASNANICQCSPLSFQASVQGGGLSPAYQWFVNGVNTGSTARVFVSNSMIPGDKVSCTYSDDAGCIAGGSVTSNVIQLGGSSGAGHPAAVTISGPAVPVCQGSAMSFTAIPDNAGASPIFQWKVNGNPAGANSSSFTSSSLVDGDQVTCTVTPDPGSACTTAGDALSNALSVAFTAKANPSVAVEVPSTTVCTGSLVTFTAKPDHAGDHPGYQWELNGQPVGTNSSEYAINTLADGDQVNCHIVTDPQYACALSTTASSGNIIMTVKNQHDPAINISVRGNDVCAGKEISFMATASDAGTSPSFKWAVNNTTYAGNSPGFNSSSLSNGDIVSCMLTPGPGACQPYLVKSNTIAAIVRELPVISLSPADTMIYYGQQLRIHALVSGTISSFEWSDPDQLVDPMVLSPTTAQLTADKTFTLTVKNDKQCTAAASAVVTINRALAMPNAFSPNGDGVNDLFRIPPGIYFQLDDFSIFDRWGARVFSSRDLSRGWDGMVGGHPAAAGVFIYFIRGRDRNGPLFVKGHVVLVR